MIIEFGEQGRVPDYIESSRYVSEDGSDLMSGNEYLHPLLGEQKQHIQGRVTWSETKKYKETKSLTTKPIYLFTLCKQGDVPPSPYIHKKM